MRASFDAMATWRPLLGAVDIGGEVSAVRTLAVSRDFLQVLGYTPALGRGFAPAEHVPGGPRVAIISHAMWRTHFGERCRRGRPDDPPERRARHDRRRAPRVVRVSVRGRTGGGDRPAPD